MKHVILLRNLTAQPGVASRGAVGRGQAAAAGLAVEVDELQPSRAAQIARRRGVEAVAAVMPMKLIQPVAANAPQDALDGGTTWGIKAVGADTSRFSGDGAVVAVLDTGIDASHPAFGGIELVRENFTAETNEDLNGHGTHCAGTIAGREVNGTRIGVAPGVKTLLIGKVLGKGGGGSDVVLNAINWALENDAHVISMSLGIDFPGFVAELQNGGMPPELATSLALEGYRANVLLFEKLASMVQARAAFAQPCVLVGAAGNESRRDENPDFQIAVSPPAVAEGIVSVAAVGQGAEGLTIAAFSNVGARVCGPGVGVLSAQVGGGLVAMNGTSMATPHVAGVAALWVEKLRKARQMTAKGLTDRLIGSATTSGLASDFNLEDVGVGIVQAPQR